MGLENRLYTAEECKVLNSSSCYRTADSEFILQNGCIAKVLSYDGDRIVSVIVTGGVVDIVKEVKDYALRIGNVGNPFQRTARNIGYVGIGKWQCTLDGKPHPYFVRWNAMFNRTDGLQSDKSYRYAKVDESFHCYQDFAQWLDDELIKMGTDLDGLKGLELDKDFKGRDKVYSKDSCILIPKEINSFIIIKQDTNKGITLPIGVNLQVERKRLAARLKFKGQQYVKHFSIREHGLNKAKELAKEAYIQMKEKVAAELLEKYKDGRQGFTLDESVFTILKDFRSYYDNL